MNRVFPSVHILDPVLPRIGAETYLNFDNMVKLEPTLQPRVEGFKLILAPRGVCVWGGGRWGGRAIPPDLYGWIPRTSLGGRRCGVTQ